MSDKKKQTIILTIIAIVVLLLAVIGATFAFFASQTDGNGETNVNVITKTTDVLSFNLEDKDINSESIKDEDNENAEINVRANMSNFTQDDISVGDGVTAQAILIANDTTNSAQDSYYAYLNINKNEFKYTNFQNEAGEILEGKEVDGEIVAPDETHTTKVPELILTITQPDGKGELTQIDGLDLEYKTNIGGKGINGFDITEATGLIPIAKNYEISAEAEEPTAKTIQEWEIKVTFINLDSNQNKNTEKEFSGQLSFQKEVIPTNLAEACVNAETIDTCIKKLEPINYNLSHIVYHNNEALTGSKLPNATLNANDNSYRFSGSSESVKNYVCLDGTSTENECSSDADLYRIIGFFKNESGKYEMKLIKYDYATTNELGDNINAEGGAYKSNYTSGNENYQGDANNCSKIAKYYWNYSNDSNSSSMWQYSNLNKINLNSYYVDTYLAKVTNLSEHITNHKWTTGGYGNILVNVQQTYKQELGTEKLNAGAENCYNEDYSTGSRACKDTDLTYSDQIGLMYVTDYGYAAYPEAWDKSMYNQGYDQEDIIKNNWMYMGLHEWTISRPSSNGNTAFIINNTGYTNTSSLVTNSLSVRPAFYLDYSTKIKSGDGSKTNPFRLSWN